MAKLRAAHSTRGLPLLAAGLALGIMMVVLVTLEFLGERDSLLAMLRTQARIVGESSIPALVFEDVAGADANLASLASIPSIRGAALYKTVPGKQPALFAAHVAPGAESLFPEVGAPAASIADLAVSIPISFQGELIAHMHVVSGTRELTARIGRYLLTVLIVASVALALAYFLTGRLRRRILETEHQLETRAHYDDLTGLPNRNLFNDRLERAIEHAARGDHTLALLFCDLDNFKVINDSLGHAVGDQVLKLVAQRLHAAIRKSDSVCRLGGDEFVAILEGCDADAAAHVADHLIRTLLAPYQIDARTLSVGTSVGIALYPADGTNAGDLLRAADTALYAAKSAGRNVFHFFSRTLDERAHERMALEHGLRHALARGELRLHYQPQVDLRNRSIIGAEALLRWHSPEFGDVAPVRFIPIAEECGLIGEIGAWVLDEACRQASAWIALKSEFVIAVNVSARQLHDPSLSGQVAACLARHRIPAHQLELEITESALLTHTGEVDGNLRALDTLEVGLSLDDFGTGYSSLSYLKRLPIKLLKIDREFVDQLPDDADDAAIVAAIIAMAGALNMDVVAEGVETEAQAAALHAAGCTYAQGWLFGAALDPAEFSRLLAESAAD